ncbi:hypothetical protein SLNWT_5230 [Streptomyces albus]|uniref:Uncharacterized protein n=1 Tax=Streptomyces albus (strain ATCC 21838 / DSM 41398 / FERM P-419 / JCM 4703 / NBRC 107858) TaxID=1081613 RepID=A0A0B5F3W4_STRA4|nr:hypothetical protein SLNWT_5230 [Streptomyces albus]AOU79908.1 hypothetical protein SLNHY_5217 [Streptomyces albus]AYN35625.1 hypothetical protein DUI70_5128 [Streptomyces albus]
MRLLQSVVRSGSGPSQVTFRPSFHADTLQDDVPIGPVNRGVPERAGLMTHRGTRYAPLRDAPAPAQRQSTYSR